MHVVNVVYAVVDHNCTCVLINSSEGEHSRSKTSTIISMCDVSTTRVFIRYKTESHS